MCLGYRTGDFRPVWDWLAATGHLPAGLTFGQFRSVCEAKRAYWFLWDEPLKVPPMFQLRLLLSDCRTAVSGAAGTGSAGDQPDQDGSRTDLLPFTTAGRAEERKLRLYACACCRRVWDRLALDCRRAVEAAEAYADGHISMRELADGWRMAGKLEGMRRLIATPESEQAVLAGRISALRYYQLTEQVHRVAAPVFTAEDAAAVAEDLLPWRGVSLDNEEVTAAHAHFYRDVFGESDQPVAFDSAWRTPAVQALARSMYDGRDFARMPDLADALEATGCGDAALLGHCRADLAHVRGCWALDVVLGNP
jgi:hypothetical protein